MVASADVDDFASTFEREFSLIACLSACSGSSRDWYIDSGASTHMIGVREVFFEITERDVDVKVELGDDMVVRAVGRGTVAFQRDCRPPPRFRDVCYVLGLEKNLISVSTIEDRGLEVLFRGGRVYILPRGANFASAKVIGTRIGKLYKLDFQPMATSVSSGGSEECLCEHLHKRRAHMHQGALQILREIVAGLPQFNTDQ